MSISTILARLNGWQRIWLVISALSLAFTAVMVTSAWPPVTVEQCIQQDRDWSERCIADRKAKRLRLQAEAKQREAEAKQREANRGISFFSGQIQFDRKPPVQSTDKAKTQDEEAPAGHVKLCLGDECVFLTEEDMDKFECTSGWSDRGPCDKYVKKQRLFALSLLGYWAAFIAVIYLSGWAIGWIVRGFTRKG